MSRRRETSDLTYKLIAAFMVMIIPIIGVLLLLNNVSFTGIEEEMFWLGVLLIMFFPIGVAGNIMLYKGRI